MRFLFSLNRKNPSDIQQELKSIEAQLVSLEESFYRPSLLGRFRLPAVGLGALTGGGVGAGGALTANGGLTALSAIVANGGTLGGSISTLLAVGPIVIPASLIIGAVAGGVLVNRVANARDKAKIIKTIQKIEALNEDAIDKKIKFIRTHEEGGSFDFIFNRNSILNLQPRTNKKELNSSQKLIPAIKMTKALFEQLIIALRKQNKKKPKLQLKVIDISDADMSDRQLIDLLAAGLGTLGTERLILKNNQLQSESMVELRKNIINKQKSFQKVKSLNLSGNKLTADCLQEILSIASVLQLEELDLSDNELLSSPRGLQDGHLLQFLSELPKRVPMLKKLSLRNINLNKSHVNALTLLACEAMMLESLDLSENAALTFTDMKNVVNKGVKHNISLKELHTDYDEALRLADILAKHDEMFVGFHKPEHSKIRIIDILNARRQKEAIPQNILNLLSYTSPTGRKIAGSTLLDEIINELVTARQEVLGIARAVGQTITMTEVEFYKIRRGELREYYEVFYNSVNVTQAKEAKAKVHPTLLANMSSNKPAAASTSQLGRVPAVNVRPHVVSEAAVRAPILPHFSASRQAQLASPKANCGPPMDAPANSADQRVRVGVN